MLTEKIKKQITKLVEGAKIAFVSSVDENGFPGTKAMLSLQRDDLFTHYFSTNLSAKRTQRFMQNPKSYKIPDWFLNRQKDFKDGKFSQLLSNNLDNKLREDLEHLKKIRVHRGLRHSWGLRVRGQHTKTTGRRGRTVGVSKKKGG